MEGESSLDLGIDGLTDINEVARGGFSTVFRARQTILDRTVAVKLIHATVTDTAGAERFLREVKAAGRLSQHPNIAPIYGAGTITGGQPYLIMPFYQRGSLANRIEREGALDEGEALRIGRTLADALEYVHQHGVLHRDVKPSNVLMSDVGEPLLCDFGVARLTDASVALHTTGTSVVTWAYGPPEAFTGGDPTPAWDVYSLGATIYTMLTGVPPFVDGENVNIFAVLNRIGNVDAPDLRDRGISPPVADAVRRAMAKPPADRPASAAEFSAMLAPRERSSRPVVTAEPSPAAVVEPEESPAVSVAAAPGVESPPVEPPPVTPEPPVEPPPVEPPPVEPPPVEPRPLAEPAPVVPVEARRAEPARTGGKRSALPMAALVLAGLGILLSIIGAGQPVYWGSDWFDGGLAADLGVWTPLLVLLASVILLKSAGTAGEWLIGAGTIVVLDLATSTVLFAYLDVYNKDSIGWVSLGLRDVGAALVLVAVVLVWGSAAHRGRSIRGPWAFVLLGGLVLIFADFQIWSSGYFEEAIYQLAVVAATIAFLACLLYRAFALRDRTNAAPALVAAGLTGAIVSALNLADSKSFGDNDVADVCGLLGFAAIVVVGIWAWSNTGRAREAPG
jgi:serine/threonine protein kinase